MSLLTQTTKKKHFILEDNVIRVERLVTLNCLYSYIVLKLSAKIHLWSFWVDWPFKRQQSHPLHLFVKNINVIDWIRNQYVWQLGVFEHDWLPLMQHLLIPSTPLSCICCMVHVSVPEGVGQYSQLAPFSLAVVWPAHCATIMPAGDVWKRETDGERERERQKEKKGTKRLLPGSP